ncbi:hypothetical protein A2U01_0018622, partial [Trifolium medium]|nr:hypothetical protein [Trifolium medium]
DKSEPLGVNYWLLMPYILFSRLSEMVLCFLDCREVRGGIRKLQNSGMDWPPP